MVRRFISFIESSFVLLVRRFPTHIAAAVFAATGIGLFSPVRSLATLTITVQQVGPNVVVNGSGKADTVGLSTLFASSPTNAIIGAEERVVTVGATGGHLATDYNGVTGSSSFGNGVVAYASTGTGDRFGLDLYSNSLLLQVPAGYISESPLAGSDTYANQSLISLGISPGTYSYTFGSGATADSLSVVVIAPVPEPTCLGLLALGAVGLLHRGRRGGSPVPE